MSQKTLFTLACIIALSACNNSRLVANEQMRQKADVVMRAIMQQHDEEVYASLAAQVKQAYSKEVSVAPLAKARMDFGEISAYQLKNMVIRVKPWDFFLAFCQIEFSAEEQNAHAVIFE